MFTLVHAQVCFSLCVCELLGEWAYWTIQWRRASVMKYTAVAEYSCVTLGSCSLKTKQKKSRFLNATGIIFVTATKCLESLNWEKVNVRCIFLLKHGMRNEEVRRI